MLTLLGCGWRRAEEWATTAGGAAKRHPYRPYRREERFHALFRIETSFEGVGEEVLPGSRREGDFVLANEEQT
jgi:hypothetical protein